MWRRCYCRSNRIKSLNIKKPDVLFGKLQGRWPNAGDLLDQATLVVSCQFTLFVNWPSSFLAFLKKVFWTSTMSHRHSKQTKAYATHNTRQLSCLGNPIPRKITWPDCLAPLDCLLEAINRNFWPESYQTGCIRPTRVLILRANLNWFYQYWTF